MTMLKKSYSLKISLKSVIFNNIIEANYFWELELKIRCYDYEAEIKELKDTIDYLKNEKKL